MSLDINDILNEWLYESGKVTVRKISGADGREKIQLRLDLGLLQMEITGRPDGKRPYGCESLLDYYEQQLEQFKKERGNDKGFELDEQACERLRSEAMMYYHRYLAEFVLEDYKAVEHDTMRNLRLMDFCNAYAGEVSDRYILEQYRPYVLMMCIRARAQAALANSRPKKALEAVKNGVEQIKEFYQRFDQEKLAEGSAELAILNALSKEIESGIPVDPLTKLRRQLHNAVESEHYEEAARLRDQIGKVKSKTIGSDRRA